MSKDKLISNSEYTTIIIGGDTVPTDSNKDLLVQSQSETVFNNVKDIFTAADLVIVNLECPLTDHNQPIIKAGPCLKAEPETINGLISAGINIFSLANNHIMDYGEIGLRDTTRQIEKNKAYFTGAGNNLAEARKKLIIEKKGLRVAVIAVAEHEFSIADENSGGANPFDPYDTLEDVGCAKANADLVIVLYHGGIEHYRLPSPDLQRTCRKMVEKGADFVICQHSHCIGSYEKYGQGLIIYGQGNLLFDYLQDEMWQEGLLIKITVLGNENNVEYIPVVRHKHTIALAEQPDASKILKAFTERSNNILDRNYVKEEWTKYVKSREYRYMQALLGFNDLIRRFDNRLNHRLLQLFYTKSSYKLLYDYLNCESHLEVVKTILKDKLLI